ncbi:hypothetical protein GJAV_G00100080 [Gymnothorax javanicus]|nr:hypothetical protein GJAV_G00100080 [Gymnothorax javanicus]
MQRQRRSLQTEHELVHRILNIFTSGAPMTELNSKAAQDLRELMETKMQNLRSKFQARRGWRRPNLQNDFKKTRLKMAQCWICNLNRGEAALPMQPQMK